MTGPQLLEALEQMRRFHKQLSTLLQTADDLMADAGYPVHPSGGSTAVSGYSHQLKVPDRWMPEFASRWYRVTPTDKHRVAFVSVLLLPHGDVPHQESFVEPLISCGVAISASSRPIGG